MSQSQSITISSGNIYIKQNSGIIEYSLDNIIYNDIYWPLTIINSTIGTNMITVYIVNNITITDPTQYFIVGSEYITFNGFFNTTYQKITISINGYSLADSNNAYNGLIQNGTGDITVNKIEYLPYGLSYEYLIPSNVINTYSNITIQNVNILTIIDIENNIYDYLSKYNGWICQSFFGYNSTNNIIYNCSSISNTPSVNNNDTWIGLIAGTFCKFESVSNCSSNNYINQYSGGILGSYCFCNTITNCYSSGVINWCSGGIIGCFLQSSLNINNCFSTGDPFNFCTGGIIGSDPGYNTTNIINISACYSIGIQLYGTLSSSILGGSIYYNPSTNEATNIPTNKPTINISNCYTTSLFYDGKSLTSYFVSPALISYIILNPITNSYYVEYNKSWSDTEAKAVLDNTSMPPIWVYPEPENELPYLLTSLQNNTPPYIFQSTRYNCVYIGEDITFTISYMGTTPINCNWYTNNVLIEGATTNSYTINNTSLSDDGKYVCRIYNNINYIEYSFYLTIVPSTYTILNNPYISIQQKDNDIQYSYDRITYTTITSWPVIILHNGTILDHTLQFMNDITITESNQYFVFGSPKLGVYSFDYESIINITLTCLTYDGLFQNGTITKDGFEGGYLNKINIIGNTKLNDYGGFLCQKYFSKNTISGVYINRCSTNIDITGNYAGGLIGAYSRFSAIINSYCNGIIKGDYAGGIIGAYYTDVPVDLLNRGSSYIESIYSTGNIIGNNAGGIFGSFATVIAYQTMFSSGDIIGINTGGIFGSDVGFNNNTNFVYLYNVYTLGNISNTSGGIFGGLTVEKQSITNIFINNTYTFGKFNNNNGCIAPSMLSSVKLEEYSNIYIANNNWLNIDANTILDVDIVNNIWTTYEDNIPYTLVKLNGLVDQYNQKHLPTPIYITSVSPSQIVIIGQPLTVQILVSGTGPITYQWKFSNDNGISYNDISDGTNNIYTISSANNINKGLYKCVATSITNSVTSIPMFVDVLSITNPIINSISPSIGSITGNTIINISGTQFNSNNTVTINNILTKVTYINSTTLQVTIPAQSAGVYNVIVTNTGTNETSPITSSSKFTYVALPSIPINISAISFNSKANITWDNLSPSENIIYYTIYCSDSTIPSVNSSTNNVNFPNLINNVSYTFTVSATNNNGTGGKSVISNAVIPRNNPVMYNAINLSDLNYEIIGSSLTDIFIFGSNFYNPILTIKSSDNSKILTITNFEIVDSSRITCRIQNSISGIFTFYISDIGGTTILENAFTFYDPPSITNVSPNEGSTMGATLLTITGTNLINVTNIIFDEQPINIFNFTSDTIEFKTLSKNINNTPLISINVLGTVITTNLFNYVLPPTIATTDGSIPNQLTITGDNLENAIVEIASVPLVKNVDYTIINDTEIIINNYINLDNNEIVISTSAGLLSFVNESTTSSVTYTTSSIESMSSDT